jgi:hypothetical protein
MKHILIISFLIASFSSTFGQKNFEGSIKFRTEVLSDDLDFKKEIEEKYGDSLLVFYSKSGKLKREYLNSKDSGNYIQIYYPENNFLYFKYRNKPKIDSTDVSINSVKLTSKKRIAKEKIMNLDCECFEYKGISKYGQNVTLNYCFSDLIRKVNFKFFEKHIDFFLNDYFQISERPYLKFSIQTDEFKISQTATQINEFEIDDEVFSIK